jgi:transcriptional regulator with XRE-family HTH domain
MTATDKPQPGNVWNAVKALRQFLGISQEKLARRLNVTVRTVARWEWKTPDETLPASTLNRLRVFALNVGAVDVAQVFEAQMKKDLDLNENGPESPYTPRNPQECAIVIEALERHRAGITERPQLTHNSIVVPFVNCEEYDGC